MEIIFSTKYWGLILFFSLLFSAAITLLLYYKSRDANELTKPQRIALMTLRFLAVFLISIFLTGPLIKTLQRVMQNPVIILAVDNSISVTGIEQSDNSAININSMVNEISDALSSHFEVIGYTFGEETRRGNILDFTEKRSGYSNLIEDVYNNHFNQNVGALLIVGDGIYNRGENPLFSVSQLSYPVYTVGLGDTTAHRDVRIAAVRANRNAFLGNKFPVEVDVRYQGMDNQPIQFTIREGNNNIYSENIYAVGNEGFITFNVLLDAETAGLNYYTAMVETAVEERNKTNNLQQFVINVLENKQKILIISHGVHPDAGALKNALESQVNYEVDLFTGEPYPGSIDDYSLMVLCNIPSSAQSGRILIEEANRLGKPMLFLLGSQSHIPQFNLVASGVDITLQAGNMEEAQAVVNNDFMLFTLSDRLLDIIPRFPPLKVPFARYNLDQLWNTLAFQRIQNINTDRPVIALANHDGQKTGIIFGEGIWRWRIYNYMMAGSHDEFTELMDKLVQYLALRDNIDNFVIDFKPVYQETESIIITAHVYNEAFEPITIPDVSIVIRDSLQQEFFYQFDKGAEFYRLNAGFFPPGDYHFDAEVEIGSTLYKETGNFAVMPVNIELMETQANHRLLYQLAMQTGGEFYTPVNIHSMVNSILENTQIRPFSYFQTLLSELINMRWLFLIVLIILSLEWFLRKFWGIY